MAFDFFTQAQGPQIDVNLFPNSRLKGAQTGNLIKTPVQAAVEGLTEGVKTGLDFAQEYQQNTIRQHQIERLPVTDQIQDEQLKQEKAQTQIAETGALIDESTRTQQMEVAKAELDKKAQDIQDKKLLMEVLGNEDPNIRAWAYKNPRFTGILSADTKLNEFAFGRAKDGLTPAEQQSVLEGIDVFKARDLIAKQRQNSFAFEQELVKKRPEAVSNFQKSPDFNYVTKGMTPQEVKEQITVEPAVTDPGAPVDKEWIIKKNGVEARRTSSSEAAKFLEYKNIEDTVERLNKAGIYGEPDPLQQARAQKAAEKAAATGSTQTGNASSFEIGGNSFNNQGGNAPGGNNANIVADRQKRFQEIAKNPPAGMTYGTAEELLLKRKAAIRAGYTSQAKAPKFANESYNILQYLNEAKQPGLAVSTAPQVDTSTPTAALSSIAGTPVVPRFDTTFKTPSHIKSAVDAEPLMQGEPALIKGISSIEASQIERQANGKNKLVYKGSDAGSPTGVAGIMQVTRKTARGFGLNRDIPEENLLAGKLTLAQNLGRYRGNVALSLAAYNTGPDAVDNAVDAAGTEDWSVVREYLRQFLPTDRWKQVYDYPDRVLSASTAYLGQHPADDNYFYGLLQTSDLLDYEERSPADYKIETISDREIEDQRVAAADNFVRPTLY